MCIYLAACIYNILLFYYRSNPDNNTHIPHSMVISSQVGNTNSSVPSNDPVVLEFHYHAVSTNIYHSVLLFKTI